MQRSLIILIMVLCTMVLMACQSDATTPDPTIPPANETAVTPASSNGVEEVAIPIEPDSETGVVRGRVLSILTTQPLSNTVVALAQVTREGEEGAFVYNTAFSPMNVTDVDGYFIIPKVPPGEFVVVVGDPYELHEIIENPDTLTAQTYFVEQGRVTEIGELKVDIGK